MAKAKRLNLIVDGVLAVVHKDSISGRVHALLRGSNEATVKYNQTQQVVKIDVVVRHCTKC